jgi:hypothetical protein
MPNISSSLGTTNDSIPAINPTQLGKFAGLGIHFPNQSSMLAAVVAERGNITAGTGMWAAGQPVTYSGEPAGIRRVWTIGASASLSHARTVHLTATLAVTLAGDSNVVTLTTGGPSAGTGSDGDLAIDTFSNAYFVKAAGTWSRFPLFPAPVTPSFFYADQNPYGNSCVGGSSDDTTALLAVMASAPAGSTVLLSNKVFSIAPDALSWNAQGVVLAGAMAGLPQQLSGSLGTPKIRILADGGFGIKVGAAANYPTGLMAGAGLWGVNVDFNGKKFTDAGLVMEGLTRPVLSNNMILRCGQNIAGRESKAIRMRVVWDALFQNNMLHSLYNPAGSVVEFDAQYVDANGNCNEMRWLSNHFEQVDGKHFCALQNSNFDGGWFAFNKHEMGTIIGSAAENYVYDFTSTHRTTIAHNHLNRYTAAKYAALYRIGLVGYSDFNKIIDNAYSAVTTQELVNGPSAAYTQCYDNRHSNASVAIGYTNNSANPWYYVKPASNQAGCFTATATNP